MSENLVHNLYKFIKEGVTPDQMFAATADAFCEKVVTEAAMLQESAEMESNQTFMLNHLNEVAPEGWEGTVKAMKANKKISNPWALAHYMKAKGYKSHASEGKLPADIANIQDPAKDAQSLKEEKKEGKDSAENPAIKTDNAGVTPEPEATKVSAEMDKETPGVDKLVQDKDGQDPLIEPAKVKEEKKETPEVTGVEKVKAENEGKVPAAPGNIDKPADYVQDLKEDAEKVIADGISDINVAKDLAQRHRGEAVVDPNTKMWKVISVVTPVNAQTVPATSNATTVPAVEAKVEEKVPCVKAEEPAKKEPVKEEKIEECPTVNAAKGDKIEKVKEDVDVTIKTDDKEVNISAANGSTTVTTTDTMVSMAVPVDGLEAPPLTAETPMAPLELESPEDIDEPEFTDEEALEMAEKLMVAEHFAKMNEKEMSAKQKKFLEDMKAKKFSKKNAEKVEKKKKEIK